MSWKSKGFSKLTSAGTTYNNLYQSVNWSGDLNFYLSFKGSCSKQKKKHTTLTPPNRIHFFIAHKLDT